MMLPTANPLVKALATGQPESYGALYDRLGRSLLRVARVMLRDPTEAEDAVQDVFVGLVRYRDRLTQVQDLDAYVFTMLRYGVLRRLQRQQKEKRRLRELTRIETAKQEFCSADELDVALKSLPPEQREVIALKIDGGLTFAQIAEVLDVNANTAASRYRYALKKLRDLLE
jgi:RNA polymerase sigma-70 factor, ECF subfamily